MTISRSSPATLTDDTLLCEACGYVIEGLPLAAPCPECGQPVEQSLPTHRTGSPFQSDPSGTTYLLTHWQALRHPARLYRTLRTSGASMLMAINILVTSLITVAPLSQRQWGTANFLVVFTAIALGCYILTFIEYVGILYYGRRRGWRVPKGLAWQICAHASVGWVLAALFVAAWYDHTDRSTLLVLAIVQGITMAVNMPAWQTLTPRIVPRDELPDAFIVQGILFNLSRIIGPALGGILLGTLGVKWLFAINALSFVGELVAIATTPAPAPRTPLTPTR